MTQPAVTPQAKEAARILLDTKSVLFNAAEPFVFTSGRLSPVYVDCRRLISFPAERARLMDMAAAIIRDECDDPDYIAGGETAGIPYAAFIAERLQKPMLYVRKQPKGFGRMAQIEGCMDDPAKKVVLVEDLQSEGTSKKRFVDALRQAGARIDDIVVIFHYGIFPSSNEHMAAMNVRLHALATWWDVLAVAREHHYFDEDTLSSVEAFLNDPTGWEAQNEHKRKESVSS